jgi:hypothetical protein
MNRHRFPWLASLLLLDVLPAAAAQFDADTVVDAADVVPGDGRCATATGACSLRAAVQEANATSAFDVVRLPAGTFTLALAGAAEDAAASGDLDLGGPVSIIGAGPEATLVVQAAGDRVVDVGTGVQATLSGLSIRGGGGVDSGGGIRNAGVLSLNDCEITDNGGSAGPVRLGGGIFNAGTLAVTGCRIAANRAGDGQLPGAGGGGIYSVLAIALAASRIEANEASGPAASGGGILQLAPGILQATVITVADNRAPSGAGLAMFGGTVSATASLWSANAASANGGGIRVASGELRLANATLSGNRAGQDGGGIIASGGTADLRNVTLADNRADADANGSGAGGGLAVAAGAAVSVRNSLLARNGGSAPTPQCSGSVQSAGYNVVSSTAGCAWLVAVGDRLDVGTDPGSLVDAGGPTPTHVPAAGDVAIDAGDPAGCTGVLEAPLLVDQRGEPRPRDGDGDGASRCDAGAVEVQPVDDVFGDGFES